MAKENFDKLIQEKTIQVSKESEIKEIKKALKNFLKVSPNSLVNAYSWPAGEVLIEVFRYVPEEKDTDVDLTSSETSASMRTRYFSIAKVLASGSLDYEVGDIVKLADADVMSVETNKWKAWTQNPYTDSNMKRKGKEPPRYMSNIFQAYGKYAFILDPLNLDEIDGQVDNGLYKIPVGKIQNKIINVNLIFGD